MANLTLGDRIKFIRHEKHLTQGEFGNLFNPPANKGVVSRWENNENIPGEDRLKQIAKMGDISVEYLKSGHVDADKLWNALHATKIDKVDEHIIGDSAFDSFAAYDISNRVSTTKGYEAIKEFAGSHYRKFNNLSISSKSATWKFFTLLKLFEKYNVEADDDYLNQHSEVLAELLEKIGDCAKDQTVKNRKAAKTAFNKLLDGLKDIDQ